ncbi:SMI1/KNR4 family protein [Deinococcus ruber]|uniref:Knr4/Smi1-like domain-containing protein n=1 Tax=Deinococcus ruber TaxID=1848197 RepID=A0A918BWH4_9DEIO|nr:SMI1/KNR4 family protein [Deinococcus ruber]GGQ96249.1 hypothetical protein GCM10008957_05610 [Deinococcus ruber]
MNEELPLQAVLERIDAWYAQHAPAIHATLRPGATEADLDALEQHTGLPLPDAFRTLYKWHDGQNWDVGGMFGLVFFTVADIKSEWLTWQGIAEEMPEVAEEWDYMPSLSHPPHAIREVYCSKQWLGFLSDDLGNLIALDFDPGSAGAVGQIITFGSDEEDKYVLASSLTAFLHEYWKRLQTDRASVIFQPPSGILQETWSVRLHDHDGSSDLKGGRITDLFPGFRTDAESSPV